VVADFENVDSEVIGDQQVCQRVTRRLQERGQYFDADPDADALAREQPLLAACYAASLQGTVALGDRAGRLLSRAGSMPETDKLGGGEAASLTPGHGYNLHAGARVTAKDRRGLEKLCKYIARGPIAEERLFLASDGRVVYRLRRPWRDGTQSLIFYRRTSSRSSFL
jgi:hypothetical protein